MNTSNYVVFGYHRETNQTFHNDAETPEEVNDIINIGRQDDWVCGISFRNEKVRTEFGEYNTKRMLGQSTK